MASETEVAAMAQQIKRVVSRDGWTKDMNITNDVQRILSKLTTIKVDADLLRRTNVGKMVKKLQKHDDEVVKGYSTSLTNKWMSQVGLADKASARSSRENSVDRRPQSAQRAVSPAAKPDDRRYENARKRIQEGYASERAKKDSRTIQVLTQPITKRKKGTTISAAPSRSSITRMSSSGSSMRRSLPAPHTSTTSRVRPSSLPGRSTTSGSTTIGVSSSSSSSGALSREELHRRRMMKYQAVQRSSNPSSNSSASASRGSASQNGRTAGRQRPEPVVDERKAMLDKMYPRVCGVSTSETKSSSRKNAATAGAATKSRSKSKVPNYTEGQREVIEWLKALDPTMVEYAPAFFSNGFDSIKMLNNIHEDDLVGIVPKKGHHRAILAALNDLKRKQTTVASKSRVAPRPRPRDRDSYRRRHDPFDDDMDSDDSFVVSDGDEYAPGAIAAMFRKNRKRRYSIDSTDSFNMEATFDEIQREEKRSRLYGEMEDYREELRNEGLLKKKKK